MQIVLGLFGAIFVTAIWLLAVSYLDYRVARCFRFAGGYRPNLTLSRVLKFPWEMTEWIGSGVLVFIVLFCCALLHTGLMVVMSFITFGFLAAFAMADLPNLQVAWQISETPPYRPPAWMHGIAGDLQGECLPVGFTGLSIGRSHENNLVLKHPGISRQQAALVYQDDRYMLINLSRKLPTLVNNGAVTQVELREGDRIAFGENIFVFSLASAPPSTTAKDLLLDARNALPHACLVYWKDGKPGHSYALLPDTTIGRETGNTILLNGSRVSRQHARICFSRQQWFIQDRNSSGGTFLNGKRVKAGSLKNGDRIRLGDLELEFRIEQ